MAAAAAILRSATRLRQPLEPQGRVLARRAIEGLTPGPRLLRSSVPTERHKCFASSDTRSGGTMEDNRSRDSMEQKSHANESNGDIYQRVLMKIDKINDGLDEQTCLLKDLEAQIKENNKHPDKHGRPIDLTPLVVMIPASLLLFILYNHVQG